MKCILTAQGRRNCWARARCFPSLRSVSCAFSDMVATFRGRCKGNLMLWWPKVDCSWQVQEIAAALLRLADCVNAVFWHLDVATTTTATTTTRSLGLAQVIFSLKIITVIFYVRLLWGLDWWDSQPTKPLALDVHELFDRSAGGHRGTHAAPGGGSHRLKHLFVAVTEGWMNAVSNGIVISTAVFLEGLPRMKGGNPPGLNTLNIQFPVLSVRAWVAHAPSSPRSSGSFPGLRCGGEHSAALQSHLRWEAFGGVLLSGWPEEERKRHCRPDMPLLTVDQKVGTPHRAFRMKRETNEEGGKQADTLPRGICARQRSVADLGQP